MTDRFLDLIYGACANADPNAKWAREQARAVADALLAEPETVLRALLDPACEPTTRGNDALRTLMENVGLYADDIAKVLAEMNDQGLVVVT